MNVRREAEAYFSKMHWESVGLSPLGACLSGSILPWLQVGQPPSPGPVEGGVS